MISKFWSQNCEYDNVMTIDTERTQIMIQNQGRSKETNNTRLVTPETKNWLPTLLIKWIPARKFHQINEDQQSQ